eukprot:5073809-Pyramimonas_sp.AAC.1
MDRQLDLKVDWQAKRERHIRATSGKGPHQSKGWSSSSRHQSSDYWEGWPWHGSGQSWHGHDWHDGGKRGRRNSD